jgi:phage tail tape-measure protein
LNGVVNQIVDNSGISWGGLAGGAAAGAAIGSFIPIIGTIAGAIVGGAIGAFSEDEADKKKKARETDLDQSKRLQVYNYVDNNWENIQKQVQNAINNSVKSNKGIKDTIRKVTSELLTAYKENLKSARVLID